MDKGNENIVLSYESSGNDEEGSLVFRGIYLC